MSYRPQFPDPTPAGFQDEEFIEFFDVHTVPGLGQVLAAGEELRDIPLLLDPDAEFHIRGIEVATQVEDALGVQFRDGYGNYLSDGYVPAGSYSGQQLADVGALPVPVECEIVCPPGAALSVSIKNLT
jgi:hypothetical protein